MPLKRVVRTGLLLLLACPAVFAFDVRLSSSALSFNTLFALFGLAIRYRGRP